MSFVLNDLNEIYIYIHIIYIQCLCIWNVLFCLWGKKEYRKRAIIACCRDIYSLINSSCISHHQMVQRAQSSIINVCRLAWTWQVGYSKNLNSNWTIDRHSAELKRIYCTFRHKLKMFFINTISLGHCTIVLRCLSMLDSSWQEDEHLPKPHGRPPRLMMPCLH